GVKLWVTRLGERAAAGGWVVYRKVKTVYLDDDEARSVVWRHTRGRVLMDLTRAVMPKGQPPGTPPEAPPPTAAVQEPPGHLPGWPAAVTTDAQGRFVLRGVGKGQGVGLLVGDDRFALQVLDFPARDRDREATRVLAAARVLEGTVTDADTD